MDHNALPSSAPTCAASVIVPTYREAANLPLLIPAVSDALTGARMAHEIIIVDDDSRDGTDDRVAHLAKSYPVRLLVRRNERGLAGAVVHGFSHAHGLVLVCMDADLSHPPECVPDLVRLIMSDEADFALGSRYVRGASTGAEWGLRRRLNSRIATLMARPLTNLRDPMSGFFALRRDRFIAARERINPIGYKIGLELMVKTHARRCRETPIHFRDRHLGASKMRLRQQIEYARQLLQLAAYRATHRRSPERPGAPIIEVMRSALDRGARVNSSRRG